MYIFNTLQKCKHFSFQTIIRYIYIFINNISIHNGYFNLEYYSLKLNIFCNKTIMKINPSFEDSGKVQSLKHTTSHMTNFFESLNPTMIFINKQLTFFFRERKKSLHSFRNLLHAYYQRSYIIS